MAFQSLWHTHLWPAETRVESWVPRLVFPLPQIKGQESGGIPGQVENYRPERVNGGIFQAWGKSTGSRRELSTSEE